MLDESHEIRGIKADIGPEGVRGPKGETGLEGVRGPKLSQEELDEIMRMVELHRPQPPCIAKKRFWLWFTVISGAALVAGLFVTAVFR